MKKILFVFLGALLLLTGIGKSSAQENIIPIRTAVAGFETWTDVDLAAASSTYLQLLVSTASTTTPAMNFDNFTGEALNFKARTFGGAVEVENTITVSISVNNGVDWTILGTRLPLTNTMVSMTEFDLSAYNGTEVKIKFSVEGTDDNKGAGIDDISITGFAPASATLIAAPTTLTGFNYIIGSGPSAEQSFALSGTTLDNSDVTITASTNYEISLTTGTGFQSTPITLTAFDGTSIPVYVRLIAGLAVADYNSELITISGGGASDVTVTCSGSVSALPTPTLVANPTTLTGFTYVEAAGPSAEKSFTVSGSNLTGFPDIIEVMVSGFFDVSLDGITYSSIVNIDYSSSELAPVMVYVRMKADLGINNYGESLTISGGGTIDNIYLLLQGSVTDPSITPCLAENFSLFALGTHATANSTDVSATLDDFTQVPGWTGYKVYQAGGEIKIGTGSLNGYVITPTIDLSAGGTVNFDYAKYTTDASVVQIFHAADGVTFVQVGSDLTPTTDFQTHSVEITDGTELSKIKIGTDVKRAFLDNIEVFCGAGSAVATLIATPTTLSGLNYIIGSGPSAEQSFNVSGTDLDNSDVTITASTNYEISLTTGTGFQSTPITLSAFDGTSTPVYVRLITGLAVADYNSELITISGGGDASDVTVSCSGSVSAIPTPTLVANPTTLSGFTYAEAAGPSAEKSFTVSGSTLNASDVSITPATNYEISLTTGSGFQSTAIVLSAFDGTATIIYVRLAAGLAIGTYDSQFITISGGGATDVDVTCNGSVTDPSTTPCLAEDFSGFIDGTHAAPNGIEVSATLDNYTATTGWTGSRVYQAGGEIKLGVSGSNGYIITPTIDLSAGGTLSFDYAFWSAADAAKVQVFHASNGVDFVQVGSDLIQTVDFQTYAVAITGGTVDSKIKIGTDVKRTFLDNISIFCGESTLPNLVADPSSLTGFTYNEGNGPSAEQVFTLSGANLDATDVIVTPSTNYEISLTTGTGFQSSPITLTAFDGTDTQVYVRLVASLAVANYNSETITISGGGASNITVMCSGSVSTIPVSLLVANPVILNGFSYVEGSGPSVEQSFTVSGTLLNGTDVSITPAADFEISLVSGTGFQSTAIVLSAFDGTATSIYVRLKSGLVFGAYDSEYITISGGGATDVDVTCNGFVSDASATSCLSEDFTGFTTGTHESPATIDISLSLDELTQTSGWTGTKIYSAGGEIKIGTGSLAGNIITPTIDLSGAGTLEFDYAQWGTGTDASKVQVFHASDGVTFVQVGSDITPTTDFQTYSILITDGTALSKIKIGTNVKRAYLDNIAVFCGQSTTPTLVATPSLLSGFFYTEGSGPSAEKSFVLSGTNLDGTNVSITPPVNYQISEIPTGGFQSTAIVLNAFNGGDRYIFVRLKEGLAFGDYNGELITISGGSAANINVTLNGTVDQDVAINTDTQDEIIKIYPNPTTDIINISIGNWKSEEISWEIVNVIGQTVLNGVIYSNDSNNSEQINISDFNAGMYFIKFIDNNEIIVRKIEKK